MEPQTNISAEEGNNSQSTPDPCADIQVLLLETSKEDTEEIDDIADEQEGWYDANVADNEVGELFKICVVPLLSQIQIFPLILDILFSPFIDFDGRTWYHIIF